MLSRIHYNLMTSVILPNFILSQTNFFKPLFYRLFLFQDNFRFIFRLHLLQTYYLLFRKRLHVKIKRGIIQIVIIIYYY